MTINSSIENKLKFLEAENERLKRENDLKSGWISLISHDFKEAFSSILILIEALEKKSISEADFFNLMPQIKQDTQKNLKIITDTGTWIKTQSDVFKPQLAEVYAVELFAHLKQEFSRKLKDKQLHFSFQGDETIGIITDRLLISFILKKIMDNAVKYSHPDGSIHFKVTYSGKYIALSIEDQGVGMDKKHVENLYLFDSPVFHGTQGEVGAGLSFKIIKKFVYLINGNIEIESAQNQGTTVSIFLPRIEK